MQDRNISVSVEYENLFKACPWPNPNPPPPHHGRSSFQIAQS